jgi:restriction system protein
VGEPVVRDFYGVVLHEKADKGIIIITSGKFSRPAQEWAKGKPIALYDGEKFVQLWRRAQAKKAPAQESAR